MHVLSYVFFFQKVEQLNVVLGIALVDLQFVDFEGGFIRQMFQKVNEGHDRLIQIKSAEWECMYKGKKLKVWCLRFQHRLHYFEKLSIIEDY